MKYRHDFEIGLLLFIILFVVMISSVSGQELPIQFTYVTSWGEKGSSPGQFRDPQSISIGPLGHLYIADTGNQRIQMLDKRGEFVTEIGGFGWQAAQFDGPVGIWAGNGLDVFVADYNNDRIQRFDKDLHYLASFQTTEQWPENLAFGFPEDVCLSLQGELFCIDGENQRILKLDVLGNPQRTFGDFNDGEGRLTEPKRLLITRSDLVYVSDQEQHSLFVFDIHGNFLLRIGSSFLRAPRGMAEINDQTIAVADMQLGIVFLDSRGHVVQQLKGSPQGGFQFMETVDVTIHDNFLYVLDSQRHAVDVFTWKIQ